MCRKKKWKVVVGLNEPGACSAQDWHSKEKSTMSKYTFKTNINCIGCATQIKPHLDKLEQNGKIDHWQVHLTDPDHTLEIETNNLGQEEIRTYVREAGFEAVPK